METHHNMPCPPVVAAMFDCMTLGAFNLQGLRLLLRAGVDIPLDKQFPLPPTMLTHGVRSATVLCAAVLCCSKEVLEMVFDYLRNRFPNPVDLANAVNHWGLADTAQPGTPRLNALSAAVISMNACGEKHDLSLAGLDDPSRAWADLTDLSVLGLVQLGASAASAVWTGCNDRSVCVRMDGAALSEDDPVSGCVPLIDAVVFNRRYRLAAMLVQQGAQMTLMALLNVDSLDFLEFLRSNGVAVDAINARDPDGGIVHVMASEVDGTEAEDAEILRFIKRHWPSMLRQVNRDGHNARQVAESTGNHAFIEVLDE